MNDALHTPSSLRPVRARSLFVLVTLGLLGLSSTALAWGPAPSMQRAARAAERRAPRAVTEVVRGAAFERSAQRAATADRSIAVCSARFSRPAR